MEYGGGPLVYMGHSLTGYVTHVLALTSLPAPHGFCMILPPRMDQIYSGVVNTLKGERGRRKLYQLHGRSLLRIGCHMTIDSLYLVDDRYLLLQSLHMIH
jgi:hypothetical protein